MCEKVTSNEQKVTSKQQKKKRLTSNEQKVQRRILELSRKFSYIFEILQAEYFEEITPEEDLL